MKKIFKIIISMIVLMLIIYTNIYSAQIPSIGDIQEIVDYWGPQIYISILEKIIMIAIVIISIFILFKALKKSNTSKKNNYVIGGILGILSIISIILIDDDPYGYKDYIATKAKLIIYSVSTMILIIYSIIIIIKNKKTVN